MGRPRKDAGETMTDEVRMIPIKLNKHYRPMDVFTIVDEDGEEREPTETERRKVFAPTTIKVPVDEARRAVQLKIADRADDF